MEAFRFLKNPGEKLLHGGQSAPAQATGAGDAPASTPRKTDAIIAYINRTVVFPRRSDERLKPQPPRRAAQDRRSSSVTATRRINGDRRGESTGTRFSRIWYAISEKRGPVDRRGARMVIVTDSRR